MKYKKYPAYKNSGVEWFDTIPEHWKLTRLKYAASVNMGQSPDSSEYNSNKNGLPFLQGCADFGVIHPAPTVYCVQPKKTANPGEILFSVRAPVGKVNLADQPYGIGRGLCAISPLLIHPRFFWWLLETVKTQLDSVSTGSTYDAVSIGQVANTFLTLPSQSEQVTIAAFLDTETAQIDTLIVKQERLIALLQEKRQALISHAVTKGLNSDAPMKDSGVEWLGEIPAHWEIKRAKWIFNKMQRPVRDEDDTLRKNRRTEGFTNALEEHGYQGIRKGDLVIHAMDAFAGAIGVSDSDGKSTPVYSVCTPSERFSVNTYYYAHLLRHMSRGGYIESLATGIRQRSTDFRFTTFSSLFLPLPPIQEQDNILTFLDAETARMDILIEKAKAAIERLNERRTALISAAVTGKIDVRAAMN